MEMVQTESHTEAESVERWSEELSVASSGEDGGGVWRSSHSKMRMAASAKVSVWLEENDWEDWEAASAMAAGRKRESKMAGSWYVKKGVPSHKQSSVADAPRRRERASLGLWHGLRGSTGGSSRPASAIAHWRRSGTGS